MVSRRKAKGKKRADGPRAPRYLSGLSTGGGSLSGAPARRGGAWVALVLGALVIVNLYVFVWDKKTSVGAIKDQAEAQGSGQPVHGKALPAAMIASQPLPAPNAPAQGAGIERAAAPVAPPGVVDGKVGKADTLGKVLKKAGLSANEADEVIRSLSGVLDFKQIRAGQPFRIERGPDGRIKLFEITLSKVQTVRTVRAANGELEGQADKAQTRIERATIGGRIDSSLYASLKAAGENGALVDFFVDVFAYDLDFYNDTHEGDTFRVVVEKELKGSEIIRYKKIVAAEYSGKAGTFRTFEWNGRYFDEKGASAEKTLLKTPLKFARISSKFDRKRMHPVLHTTRAHLGIDYAAPPGTPVWAAAAGVVSHRAPSGGAGNLVMIRHDGGYETAYMHLQKFAKDIKVGDRIAAKTVIGYVGTTGLSTGPHLHFGVKKNGGYIDPSKLAPIRGRGVPASELASFRAQTGQLGGQLAGISIPAQAPAAPASPAAVIAAPVAASVTVVPSGT